METTIHMEEGAIMLEMKGAMIAYNPCYKCENTQMCSMCEITYYRKMLGVNNSVTDEKILEKERQWQTFDTLSNAAKDGSNV